MTAIRVRGLDHVVLRVTHLATSIDFYCDVLGCTEERRLDALGLVQLRAGKCLIDLIEVASPLGKLGGKAPGADARNMDHFAVALETFDEAAIRSHLEARGVEPGEVSERYGAKGNGPSMYIRDPDGNVVELKGPAGNG
jgi:catechol 2,3-dioxygenase-like lactoylglutathione lyase family enzyme